ncbi:MAG: DUF5818 domain-containing protein [Polyangiaceae bacterium]
MATYRGTIRKSTEAGVWELITDDGTHYQLRSSDRALQIDGQRVSVDGRVANDAMGIGMAGPTLDVKRWSKA